MKPTQVSNIGNKFGLQIFHDSAHFYGSLYKILSIAIIMKMNIWKQITKFTVWGNLWSFVNKSSVIIEENTHFPSIIMRCNRHRCIVMWFVGRKRTKFKEIRWGSKQRISKRRWPLHNTQIASMSYAAVHPELRCQWVCSAAEVFWWKLNRAKTAQESQIF